MNQSKETSEEATSFVQQKRIDGRKGHVDANTHSRIFGWLDDHNDCVDSGNGHTKKPHVVEKPLSVQDRPAAGSHHCSDNGPHGNHSQPENGPHGLQHLSRNPITQTGPGWPEAEPGKGMKRQYGNKNADHF